MTIPLETSPRTLSWDHALYNGFVEYLLSDSKWKTTRSAASAHTNRADMLVRYLWHTYRAPISSITEFDLRYFLYDFFPADFSPPKGDITRTLGSLRRFFDFLGEARGIHCAWAAELLADRDLLKGRPRPPAREAFGAEEITIEWIAPLYRDLEHRLFIPSPTTPTTKCVDGATHHWLMHLELMRLWLAWRDELIGDGYNRRVPLERALVARQLIWEHTVHPVVGRTPAQIAAEPEREENLDKGWDPFGLGWQIDPFARVWRQPSAGNGPA